MHNNSHVCNCTLDIYSGRVISRICLSFSPRTACANTLAEKRTAGEQVDEVTVQIDSIETMSTAPPPDTGAGAQVPGRDARVEGEDATGHPDATGNAGVLACGEEDVYLIRITGLVACTLALFSVFSIPWATLWSCIMLSGYMGIGYITSAIVNLRVKKDE